VALSAGITTLRDVGAYQARNNKLRDAVNAMAVPLARILSCGHHITVENGHFWERGIVWNRSRTIEHLVDQVISEGADFIKVMNDDRIFNDDELLAIVNAARKLHKKVACHAYTVAQIQQAAKCGVDTIEHGYPATPEIIELLNDNGVAICPTMVAAVDSVNCEKCEDKKRLLDSFPDCSAQVFREWHDNIARYLPTAFANDLSIISGTDAGIFPTPFDSIHRELELFKIHGGSVWKILQSATVRAASALGIDRITGEICPGKSADLIILQRDPLAGLSESLRHITHVVYRGNVVWKRHA
jgi:imidazolonepropionase-like amidohydrolase